MEQKVLSILERRLEEISNNKAIPNTVSIALAKFLTSWAIKKEWIKKNKSRIFLTQTAKNEID